VVLRVLAIALALQLLALPALHGLVPCHDVEEAEDSCCAARADAPGEDAARDTFHAAVDHVDHHACICPCHARVLSVPAPPSSPTARVERRAPDRLRGPPPWRTDAPPTPPPQA